MRILKFRAWSTNADSGMYYMSTDNGMGTLSDLEENDTWKVMQFTGLLDKNGKEIYEGDIVKVLMTDWASKSDSDPRTLEEYLDDKSETYVIGFHRAEFSMFSNGDEDYPHFMSWGTHGFIKVIGNIYENPEILTDE